ncbi:hypothetical protein [Lacisediminihabitans profunda]|uniref:hypothetical protein n=1 Tax=Lacisediminihabitans profunda TaxID=2594790 RepID=UPI0016507C3A|nr:hypothetical protein [Lacisediminihabitans profunda]
MPAVIARHNVKDPDHWLASPKRQEVVVSFGVTNTRTLGVLGETVVSRIEA